MCYNSFGGTVMNCYDFELTDYEKYFLEKNENKFRAKQIFDWLYKKSIQAFDEITNMKKSLLEEIKKDFSFPLFTVLERHDSLDGTIKFLFKLQDGNLIETVLMNHDYGKSICVSSQIGCNMGCSFCASGLLGKVRNLTAGEMVLQVVLVERLIGERIGHVVVMGIGEPFDNYDNVMKFLRIINSPFGLEIGARHITVSTSGIVPRILDYANEGLQTNLAISLHAPNDEIRDKMMKINKAYPIAILMDAISKYIEKTGRRVTIEYILIKDVNDTKECAYELSKLLKGLNVYVNLIPYNEVLENPYRRSGKNAMTDFYDILKKNNINTTLRREQGHDIKAACGQLRAKKLV